MNRRQLLVASAAAAFIPGISMSASPALPTPPVARKEPKRIEQLGRVRVDDYASMKDDNWQKVLRDPTLIKADVKAHLTEENAYTKAMLARTEDLQKQIFEEMKGRIKQDDASVPAPDGPWEYYSRYETGAEHPIHARKARPGGAEEVLLNEEVEAKGKAYYQVGSAAHSPDHRMYAWMVDEQGSEVYRLHTRDIGAGKLLGEPVESVSSFSWSPDSKYLFWVLRDDNGRPAKVYRRPAGGTAKDDVLIYDEPDEGFFIGVGPVSSEKWIVISVGNQETSEAWLIPASDPTAAPKVMEPRQVGVRYEVEHWGDHFVIRTNADGAVDWKLVVAEEANPGKSGWR